MTAQPAEFDPLAIMAPEDLDDFARRVWDLHSMGCSNRQIAKKLGSTHPTVGRVLSQLVETTALPSKQESIATELHALNRWQMTLEEELRRAGADAAKNISTLIKLSESRRNLLGTNAPEEYSVTLKVVDEARGRLAQWLLEDPSILEADVVEDDEGEDDA